MRFLRHRIADERVLRLIGKWLAAGVIEKGRFWIRRKTDSKRARAKLAEVKAEIRRRRCLPLPDQGRWLAAVVRGHQACYAVPGNSDAVNAFRTQIIRHWHKALRRRSQKTRNNWGRMNRIATRWIPQTRTVHPFLQARFAATHPKWKPSAEFRTLGSVQGPPARAVPTATGDRAWVWGVTGRA